MLNILSKSYIPWLPLQSGRKLHVLPLREHFYFGLFQQAEVIFFFQWASFSLAEALKISKGGNALKHLISSQEAEPRGGGAAEAVPGGNIYTDNEIFLRCLLWPGILSSSLAREEGGSNSLP